jgi:amino acid permease
LQKYETVSSGELSKWLWLDFSLPARSPIAKQIRRNMRNFSRESLADSLCVSPEVRHMGTIREDQCVGLSQMATKISAPLGEGSLAAGVFTLVSSAMGAGCLSLPFMLKTSGIIPGLLLLLMGALLAHLSLVVLMSCARYTESGSMARLVALTARGGSGRMVDGVIAIYGIAAVLCYLMFIGDFFLGIVRSPLLSLSVSREALIVTISVLVVWPLSLPRDLSALRYVCVLSVLAICLTALVVACRAPSYAAMGSTGLEEDAELWKLKWWTGDALAHLKSFSIALFAFAAHTNAVPVATSLKQADAESIQMLSQDDYM